MAVSLPRTECRFARRAETRFCDLPNRSREVCLRLARAQLSSGYALGIWLVSVGTAVSLAAALVGAVLARALTDLSPLLAVLIGGVAGWVLSSLFLGAAAERLDRRLHRMGGGPVFRRRRR
jgi:hypothetical protein